MSDEPLTYGPDMFFSDVTLPDPTTVLNEPLPRAWSQGGMIEAVKRAVITGLRESFGNSSLGAGEQKYYIDIEYPTDPTSYPGIWVQFLCDDCNHGLGFFRDSIDRMRCAIKYLENAT